MIMQPYDYQSLVADRLLSGRSVVLQAPTGAGKTHAALSPFLQAWRGEVDSRFPNKCVYVVPMRVLAHQFAEKARAEAYADRNQRLLDIRIQTGDAPEDRRFEAELTFCTVDQFLSSFLTMPYSLPARLANLNAGAMVGAYLVCDEFHLLDPSSTLPTVLYTLKQLSRVAPVLLMTATFSQAMLTELARELHAETVLVSKEEAATIDTRRGKHVPRQRVWRVADGPLTAEAVLAVHNRRSLALCNTVGRARLLFRALRKLAREQAPEVEVLLLHSRFLPEDRRRTEDRLRALFGEGMGMAGSVIAVATQTIEVGLDITCETLHTEVAPAGALIQRAGRCARFPAEQGQVIVYPVEKPLPYRAEQAAELPAALAWLSEHQNHAFDFKAEQDLVNAVATPSDRRALDSLSSGRALRADAIQRVLGGDRQGDDRRLLVRDADSRLVLIHTDPGVLLERPYSAVGFNLPVTTLRGLVKEWTQRDVDLEWRVKRLEEDPDRDENNRTAYGWHELSDASELNKTQVIVVHADLAGYRPDEGFIGEEGGSGFLSTLLSTDAVEGQGGALRLESYEAHIGHVLRAFESIALPELCRPAAALERAAGWPDGAVLRAAWLVCLLHDVGKLDRRWQGWARAYQAAIGRPVTDDFAAGHTDWNAKNPTHQAGEQAVRHQGRGRPHHAAEGALAVGGIIMKALDNELLTRAALAAITRHHAPFATTCGSYRLEERAAGHIALTLPAAGENAKGVDLRDLRAEVSAPPHSFGGLLIRPEQGFGWLAYTLFVRALRRADQEGTRVGALVG